MVLFSVNEKVFVVRKLSGCKFCLLYDWSFFVKFKVFGRVRERLYWVKLTLKKENFILKK